MAALPVPVPTTAPAVLPDSSPRPAGTPLPAEARQAEQDKRDARKTSAELQTYRTHGFPAPAGMPPDRIIIPAIDVDSTIVEVGTQVTEQDGQLVSEWQVADFAVGFHNTSALPGASGNTVMTGHNNINGEVFRNLSDLKGGDEIFVLAGGQPYRYVVAQKLLVKEKGVPIEQRLQNAVWIGPTAVVRLTGEGVSLNVVRKIAIDTPGVAKWVAAAAVAVDTRPIDTTITVAGKRLKFRPSVVGWKLDQRTSARRIGGALRDGRRDAELKVDPVAAGLRRVPSPT